MRPLLTFLSRLSVRYHAIMQIIPLPDVKKLDSSDLGVKSKRKCASNVYPTVKQSKKHCWLKFGSPIYPHYFRPRFVSTVVLCSLYNIFVFIFEMFLL